MLPGMRLLAACLQPELFRGFLLLASQLPLFGLQMRWLRALTPVT
jgi:hypothetical protein